MTGSASLSGEMTFRPNIWRDARFKLAAIVVEYVLAVGVWWLIDQLSGQAGATSRLRPLDLAIVAGVLFLLGLFYTLRNRDRAAIRLSRRGIETATGLGGAVTIAWDDLDWPRTRDRGLLDRLLGQRPIYGKSQQRILWRQVAFAPADVQAILDAMERRRAQS